MKILHTADWHLGKRLDSFSRMEEQIAVMKEIVSIARTEAVDMVIIAGDLFDTFNPPVEAVDLFFKTLKELSNNGERPVIAISGNHDAPGFIDAPNPLAKACGIILIGRPNSVIAPFDSEHFSVIRSDRGFLEIKLARIGHPVRVLHTAYANEQRLKEYLGEDKETQLNEILRQNWRYIVESYCDEKGVNILTAHLYMNKKGGPMIEEPDGEKPLKIGNASLIYSDAIPEQVQYTALGHIHGHKNIGTSERPVIYASSPIGYSFSEAGQKKYVSIVTLEPGMNAQHVNVELTAGRPLYRKTFDDVDEAVAWLNTHQDALVELTLISDTYLKAEDRKRIYQAHGGIIFLIPRTRSSKEIPAGVGPNINIDQDISSLFRDYFKSKNNDQEPNEAIMQLFKEILNS